MFSPVPGAGITTPYGRPGRLWASGRHTGVDYAAPSGSPVMAAVPGRVISVGWAGAYGNRVAVQHQDGTVAYYSHLSGFGVRVGQQIQRGSFIGRVGSTGNATGPHLHFEIRRNGKPVNPFAWLQADFTNVGRHVNLSSMAGVGMNTQSVEWREFIEEEPEPMPTPVQATAGAGYVGTELDLDEQLQTELPAARREINPNV